jgi:hypothetical protein
MESSTQSTNAPTGLPSKLATTRTGIPTAPSSKLGTRRKWKPASVSRAGVGLKSAGLGRARALHCGLRLLRAWPGLGAGSGSGLWA